MTKNYVIGRIARSVLLVWSVSLVTFGLMQLAPGGPAILADPNLSKEQIDRARETLGLDEPIPVQYLNWAGRVLQGDLGTSFDRGTPVVQTIVRRLPNTIILTGSALVFAMTIGIGAGLLAAIKRDSWVDHLVSGGAVLNLSLPQFWLAIIVILVFAVNLRWLPATGTGLGEGGSPQDFVRHLILPTFVAGSFLVAVFARFTRSAMLDVFQETYITNARAQGLSELRVTLHALRNCAVPLITITALSLPALVGGTAIVESIFRWPGLGSLAIESARSSDYPLIMGVTLIVSTLVIAINLLADLSYAVVDPRIKLGATDSHD